MMVSPTVHLLAAEQLAGILGTSIRTAQRRLVELGVAQPSGGRPVTTKPKLENIQE